MKVILLQDVAKLGRRHSIVTVADGRGLNQLIPKGWALPATPVNLKKVEAQNAKVSANTKLSESKFKEAADALKALTIEVEAAANAQGHLFEAIKPEKIVEALAAQGLIVSAQDIVIETPIKSIGAHEITLSHKSNHSTFTITVTASS
jgi:large subunit ribosomal protein L9